MVATPRKEMALRGARQRNLFCVSFSMKSWAFTTPGTMLCRVPVGWTLELPSVSDFLLQCLSLGSSLIRLMNDLKLV